MINQILIEASVNNTTLVWVGRACFPEDQTQKAMFFVTMDLLSAWGGCNENNEDYMMWEFPPFLPYFYIRRILSKLNVKETSL